MHAEVEQELIQSRAVSALDIQFAKEESRKNNSSILINLLANRSVEEASTITKILAQHYKIPLISLNKMTPPPKLMNLCNSAQARKLFFLPISEQEHRVVVGMVDPLDLNYIDEVGMIFRKSVQPVFISKDDFERNFYRFFRQGVIRPEEGKSLMDTQALIVTALGSEEAEKTEKRVAVRKFASNLIFKALSSGASALNIEPQQQASQVSLLIDGSDYNLCKLSNSNHRYIVTAIMELAKMDASSSGVEQHSRRRIGFRNQEYTLIYRITPTPSGERVTVYIVNSQLANLTLEELGLPEQPVEELKNVFKGPGIFLITGASGSGKSTTLQALIRYAASMNKSIFTIEDIVRQKIEGVLQRQLKPEGPSKSTILNSLLSRKVDVVVVDEADKETLPAAVEAASRGSLVLLSVSAPSAKEALAKLLCSDVSRSKLALSLKLIYSQRIIRKLCPSCKTEAALHPATIKQWKVPKSLDLHTGKGCDTCSHTGYQGTMPLTELLPFNEELGVLINQGASGPEIVEEARYQGMLTLFEQGINEAIDGVTSLEEVLATLPCDEPIDIKSRMKFGHIMPMQKRVITPMARSSKSDANGKIEDVSIPLSSEKEIIPSAEESHGSMTFSGIAMEPTEKPEPLPPTTEAKQDEGNEKTSILLVDDSPVTLEFTKHILTVSGYFNVDTTDTGIKALEMLQQKQYHLVITDQEMPEQSGQEFIESIRQHPSLNGVGTILLTGNLNEMSALGGGADGYISKPTDPELLVARAKSISDIYRRLSGVAPMQPKKATPEKQLPSGAEAKKMEYGGKADTVEFTAEDMARISSLELDSTMNSSQPLGHFVPPKVAAMDSTKSDEEESDFDNLFK